MSGRTEENTRAAGNYTGWMEKAHSLGRQERSTRVASSITRDTAMAFSHGKTGAATKATGKTVSNMGKGLSSRLMGVGKLGYGERGNFYNSSNPPIRDSNRQWLRARGENSNIKRWFVYNHCGRFDIYN